VLFACASVGSAALSCASDVNPSGVEPPPLYPTRGGIVWIDLESATTSSIDASFYETFGFRYARSTDCHQRIEANCAIASCDAPTDGGHGLAPVSSGTITVSPPLAHFGSTLAPSMTGWYTGLVDNSGLWFMAGDSVSFSASGATVPAWSAAVTIPDAAPDAMRDISGGRLAFHWQPTQGIVEVDVGSGLDAFARCNYRGDMGLGIVPDGVVRTLGGVAAINNHGLSRSMYVTVSVGGYDVMVVATQSEFTM
jgi:hypothetical protein